MPTLTFSSGKHIFLTFSANEVETDRDGAAMLLSAQGEITQQETPLLEERIALPTQCHVAITEGEKTLVSERFTVTFLAVEPDQLVARLGE